MTRAAGQSRVSTHLPSTSQVCCVQVASAKRPRLSHIGIVAGLKNSRSLKLLGVHLKTRGVCGGDAGVMRTLYIAFK